MSVTETISATARPTRFRIPGADGLTQWIVPLVILIVWQVACVTGFVPARVLPAPSDVALAGWKLPQKSGELVQNIWVSFWRAAVGFVIGGGIGFALGLANGLSQLSSKLTDTTLQMVRNVPHLALIPLVILWFGIDESAKIFLVALGVFFPIYINTLHGIRTVDPQLIEMGRIYGMTNGELFRRVIFPGALPSIFVGLRFALGIMWLTLIVAETIAASSGLGYYGDAGPRVHADRCRGAQHPDLRLARQARRQHCARAGALHAVLASGLPETLRMNMNQALRFAPVTTEAADAAVDLIREVRVARGVRDPSRAVAHNQGLAQVLRRQRGAARHRSAYSGGAVRRHRRQVRLRQEHVAASDRGAGEADRWQHRVRRSRGQCAGSCPRDVSGASGCCHGRGCCRMSKSASVATGSRPMRRSAPMKR